MADMHAVPVEYLNPQNACEAIEGEELARIEADNPSEAVHGVSEQIRPQGFSESGYTEIEGGVGSFANDAPVKQR